MERNFTWSATGPDLYLLGRIYSVLGIRPRHTGYQARLFVRLVGTTDVVPKTRHFIDHVSFGYGIRNALYQDRKVKIEEALLTPPHLNRFEPFDRFVIAYADAEEWLAWKDMAKAEKLFLEVAKFAGGFLRYGRLFEHLTALFPIEHNRITLYSSVVLYYLCKIRANPDDFRVHAGDPRACLISAAEHGIIALRRQWMRKSGVQESV